MNNSPFGKKADSEVIQTYAWIQSHLEEDISVSIPKHEVYEEYRSYCEANHFEKLCVADFGKAMKHIFPQVKPRRLGQRGNSKYCYSGLRKKIILTAPELPALETSDDNINIGDSYESSIIGNSVRKNNVMVNDIVWNIIHEWMEKTFNRKFKTSIDFARYLIETQNIKSDLDKMLSISNNNVNGNCFSTPQPPPPPALNLMAEQNTKIDLVSETTTTTTTANKSITNGKKISLNPIGSKLKSIMNDNNKKKYSSTEKGATTTTLSTPQQQQIIDNSSIDNTTMMNCSKISTINTAITTSATNATTTTANNNDATLIQSLINRNSLTTLQQPPKTTATVVTNHIPEMVN